MKLAVIAALFLSVVLHAQSAKVIQLSPEDAKQAKALNDAAIEAQKKLVNFNESLRQKYLKAAKDEENRTMDYNFNGTWIWVKPGWGTGQFEYSEDFRFIVPKSTPVGAIETTHYWKNGCNYINPVGSLTLGQ